MFLLKNNILEFSCHFYYVIKTLYIHSWKQIDEILTHFGDATYQK